MVVVDIGGVDPHPAVRTLGAAQKLGLLDDVRAHGIVLLELRGSGGAGGGGGGEMLVEESKDLAPAVERLLRPISRPRGVEEGVAGAVVAVKLVALAELLEHRLGAVHLI